MIAGLNAPTTELDSACETLSGHVIICGFGRIGQNLANILREMNIPYVALDLDHQLSFEQAWEAGENVFYGDSTRSEILKKTELVRASALIITFDDALIAEKIIRSARQINTNIPIVVRSKDDQYMDNLHSVGATNVVPESFEASMMLAIHVLQHMGISTDKSLAFVTQARKDDYRQLRGYFRGEESLGMDEPDALRLHTVILSPDSYAVGKSMDIINLEKINTTILAVRRGRDRLDSFDKSFQFEIGDAVVIEGIQSAVLNAEKYLLRG